MRVCGHEFESLGKTGTTYSCGDRNLTILNDQIILSKIFMIIIRIIESRFQLKRVWHSYRYTL